MEKRLDDRTADKDEKSVFYFRGVFDWKAEEGGDVVASLTDDTKELKLLADGNSDKSFGEM